MSEGYGEGRKSWDERVKVVAEAKVDEFVMRVCLLALEDATSPSFLPRSDTSNYRIVDRILFKRKGKERKLKLMRFFSKSRPSRRRFVQRISTFHEFLLAGALRVRSESPSRSLWTSTQTDQSNTRQRLLPKPVSNFPSGS